MHLIGIEPTHAAPEATALSTELQTHLYYITILFQKLQLLFLFHVYSGHTFRSDLLYMQFSLDKSPLCLYSEYRFVFILQNGISICFVTF